VAHPDFGANSVEQLRGILRNDFSIHPLNFRPD
jgi:hypothetical protein